MQKVIIITTKRWSFVNLPIDGCVCKLQVPVANGIEEIELSKKNSVWYFDERYRDKLKKVKKNENNQTLCLDDNDCWYYRCQTGEKAAILSKKISREESKKYSYLVSENECITVGRDRDNHIIYNCYRVVSGKHLKIVCRVNSWIIEAIGENGYAIDGNHCKGNREVPFGTCIELFGLQMELGNHEISLIGIKPEAVSLKRTRGQHEKLSLFDVYGAKNVNGLQIEDRWKCASVEKSLSAHLGMDENDNPVVLDLSEHKHGPHGIVAGMTGAGKTVALQQIALSLCVNYAPWQLQMVLIDFKGGDMALPLAKLPHVTGIWTNLENTGMERCIYAIENEIRKREVLFADTHTFHIDEYNKHQIRRGKLPHICIIVDEFAQLNVEYPEAVKVLQKVSRVGRSLGIHLILATQKPAGSIEPQFWTNSKFRLCLAVKEIEDSVEMIGNPSATTLKNAGAAILDRGIKGELIKCQIACGNDRKEEKLSQNDIMLRKIEKIAHQKGYLKQKMWMDPLDEALDSGQLSKENSCIVLGMADDIFEQKKSVIGVDLETGGNIGIIGENSRQKAEFVQNFIMEHCAKYDYTDSWMIVSNFGASTLDNIPKYPQIAGYAMDEKSFGKAVDYLLEELEQRESGKNHKTPTLWFVINEFANMREITRDVYWDKLYTLWRKGKTVGIHMVITSSGFGAKEIPVSWQAGCNMTICMSKNLSVLKQAFHEKTIPKRSSENDQRGYVQLDDKVMEIQLLSPRNWNEQPLKQDGFGIDEKQSRWLTNSEEIYDYEYFMSSSTDKEGIPFAYDDKNGCQVCIGAELQGDFVFVAKAKNTLKNSILLLMEQLERKEMKIAVLGSSLSEWKGIMSKRNVSYLEEPEETLPEDIDFIIVEELRNWVQADAERMKSWAKKQNAQCCLICEGRQYRLARRNLWMRSILEKQQGVYVGVGFEEQSVLECVSEEMDLESRLSDEWSAVLITKDENRIIRIPKKK
ncbi:MAG: FHA domain-containing protein [Lachnospiraceae bacterium]|nr:FHA domain-containing protein [Lachnospiraceae bacterium]